MGKSILLFLFAIIALAGCKKRYYPPVSDDETSILVVDGFINNSGDTTFIRLSHTNKLDSGIKNSIENEAQLTLENVSGNTLYSFQEMNNDGIYFVPGINLNFDQKYRLRINTSNGKQYLSDDMPVLKTPAIDSISFGITNNNFAVYANTHDAENKTWYYRWAYTETWNYKASFFSSLIARDGVIYDRQPSEYVYECWKTQQNTQLLLGNSTKLAEDIIYHFPVRLIDFNSVELSIKYFISLRQYALTKEAYEYLENLKRITEQTGSLFDPQPSEINGNIHAVNNPGKTALGYLITCTPSSKQLYITNSEVQPWDYNPRCVMIELHTDEAAVTNEFTLLSKDGYPPKGIFATTRSCGDCTVLGGTTVKPPFWQ
ncbi:MAG: DUF4249 domain-containing protein [Chitinophagaceae bacterium]